MGAAAGLGLAAGLGCGFVLETGTLVVIVLVIVVVVEVPGELEPAPTQTVTDEDPMLDPCDDPLEQANATGPLIPVKLAASRKLNKPRFEIFLNVMARKLRVV